MSTELADLAQSCQSGPGVKPAVQPTELNQPLNPPPCQRGGHLPQLPKMQSSRKEDRERDTSCNASRGWRGRICVSTRLSITYMEEELRLNSYIKEVSNSMSL